MSAIISSIACNNIETIEECKLYGNIDINATARVISKRQIRFLQNPLNALFLKRAETSEISINSIFTTGSLPGEKLAVFENGEPALTIKDGVFYFNFDPFYSIRYYLNEEKGSIQNKSIFPHLIKFYWRIPKLLRPQIRKMVRRKRRSNIKPPEDFLGVYVNILSKILENCFIENGFEIKEEKRLFAVTHDIDTCKCYNDGISYIREIEKSLNIPTTVFIVPFGQEYDPDLNLLADLSGEDFEIGLHGFSHDGHLLREGPIIFEKKIKKALNFLKNGGIEIFGYRNPYLMRSEFLLESLSKLRFQYDSSSPDIDTLPLTRPYIGLHYNKPITRTIAIKNNITRRILQIPSSYPQDVQILDDYNLNDKEAFNYFKVKIDFIKDFDGLFIFHTHPIYLINREGFFKGVIEYAKSKNFLPLLMKEIASKYQNQSHDNKL